ncbi:MAG: ATP-binding protein [Candidatus Pacebacteria bacterium]|jgi:uncharacterized protein|nr:ATP-binding protein [Candidatus Paceibacterota bacterium]MBT3511632.1 ATP-binding protein [Candidatus Paceibacterota bacterium]MBT4004722.1 ATP-binding protein [Candidatus Paceibacterota bacterium]MBT4359260.1 ATP-binding protein [Candidatus Paceibacterota bacterium]MBT4681040.1 ATP-binding protein [Candidatus Paceibacterota bacterium]
MITLEQLKQAISESKQLTSKPSVARVKYFSWLKKSSKNKLIKAIVGFRRSGKSYLLKMFSEYLVTQKIPHENIFYLNFENDLLIGIKTVQDLRKIWELYLSKVATLNKPIYIIWDEIQLVDNWEKLVRTLYETEQYNIYLSGSNSKLLSGEFASSLSGRAIELRVQPFSFKEYLDYLKLNYSNYYSNKAKIDQAFNHYLSRGGIAEQFDLDDDLAKNYSQGLTQKIILDDIIRRYQIDKVKVLQNIFEFISGNITSTLSLRKIVNRVANQGINISSNTLDNYIHYWETSYALAKLTKFDYRLSRVFERTAKYYTADNIFVPGGRESDEKRLENLVYHELVRRYGQENIFFGSEANGYEVDFVVKQKDQFLFYQVCLELNNDNLAREAGNLNLIQKYQSGVAELLVLNNNCQDVAKYDSINVKSITDWLLKLN